MVYEKSTFARMRKNFHDPNLFRPQSKKKINKSYIRKSCHTYIIISK